MARKTKKPADAPAAVAVAEPPKPKAPPATLEEAKAELLRHAGRIRSCAIKGAYDKDKAFERFRAAADAVGDLFGAVHEASFVRSEAHDHLAEIPHGPASPGHEVVRTTAIHADWLDRFATRCRASDLVPGAVIPG